jgi:hypothetical protein
MGRVVHGASCPWGELSVERNVHGASCPWGEMSVGQNVRGAKCPWGEMSWGELSWGELSWGELSWGELSWGEWSGNRGVPSPTPVSMYGVQAYTEGIHAYVLCVSLWCTEVGSAYGMYGCSVQYRKKLEALIRPCGGGGGVSMPVLYGNS